MKIYGYRVDDTLNTGYRIMDSLSRGEPAKEATEAPKQSRKLGVVNTLESNESALQMDASELSFDADPLFHVMSRRFDEGGARGLLLSNLVMQMHRCDAGSGRLSHRIRLQRRGGGARDRRSGGAAR